MKKTINALIPLVLLAFSANTLTAQTEKKVISNISIEAKYGMNVPISPNTLISKSDYNGFSYFEAGINYHIDDIWGVKGSFASSTFQHKNIDNLGVNYSKLSLEGTYNIISDIKNLKQAFDVTAHAGLGLGIGSSKSLNSNDDMVGVLQIGIMPKYLISSEFAIFIDGTYVNQLSQDYSYNGLANSSTKGSYFNLGLGVQYRFQ